MEPRFALPGMRWLGTPVRGLDFATPARLFGGRWNRKGVPVIYCASTTPLAALEVLAHSAGLPAIMVLIEA